MGSSIRLFDFPKIHAQHVTGRRLVYLDNGIWIDLTDAKTDEAKACLSICRKLRETKKIIFPLSLASITEVLDNPLPSNRILQAQLMDEFSDGICLRYPSAVAVEEISAASPLIVGEPPMPIPVNRVFTYVAGYLGDSAIDFPEEWPRIAQGEFARLIQDQPELRSVAWLCEHLPVEEMRRRHRDLLKSHYVPRSDKSAAELSENARGPNGKLDRKAIIENERLYLFREQVCPIARTSLLKRFTPAQLAKLIHDRTAKEGEGNPARLAELFQRLPSLELFAEIMSSRVLNPGRKTRPNDFMDNHHAHVAPAYCELFATTDGGLKDLLAQRCSVPKMRGCRVIHGIEELVKELRAL